jgi:hypothetical protein
MREKGTASESRSLLGRSSQPQWTASLGADDDPVTGASSWLPLQSLAGAAAVGDGAGAVDGGGKLGTWLGVFVPCLVQIFGLTTFVRLPFIVGEAGLVWALALYLIAVVIISLTLCSLCALVTNGDISGGGAYFVISRSLGPEFGGAIGVVFMLANLISVTAYCNVLVTQLKDVVLGSAHDGGGGGDGGSSGSNRALIFSAAPGLDDYVCQTLMLGLCVGATMSGARFVARASVPVRHNTAPQRPLGCCETVERPYDMRAVDRGTIYYGWTD